MAGQHMAMTHVNQPPHYICLGVTMFAVDNTVWALITTFEAETGWN